MRYLCVIVIAMLFTSISGRSEPAKTNEVLKTTPPISFDKILSELRDPFWPIGWRPQSTSEEPPHVRPLSQTPTLQSEPLAQSEIFDWNDAWKTIKIKAKSQNWAIIDGQSVTPKGPVSIGDIITVIHKDKKYRWRIISITKEEGITAERIDVTKWKGN